MATKKPSKHPVDVAFKPIDVHEPGTPEYEHSVNSMRDHIVQTYLAATPDEHRAGERFYSHDAHGAARALALGVDPSGSVGRLMRDTDRPGEHGHSAASPRPDIMGERVHRAAGVLARLSPQTEWETNVRQAHETFHMDDNATQALHNLRTDARDPARPTKKQGKVVPGQFDRYEVRNDAGDKMDLNKQPSRDILRAHDIATGRAQPEDYVPMDPVHRVKIGSFAHNIEHPDSSPHTTVDFRAHDVATGQLLSTSTDRGLSGNAKSVGRTKDARRYDMIEEAHNRAADFINENHADRRQQRGPLQPKQVQAVTWWADKNYQDEQMGGVMQGGHLHAGADGGVLRRPDLGRPVGQGNNEDRGTRHLGAQFGGAR